MPKTTSALKRMRKSERQRLRNKAVRSGLRTAIKKVRAGIASGDPATAQGAFLTAVPIIDRAVAKGVIHKNVAARYKSRLAHQINALKAAQPAA